MNVFLPTILLQLAAFFTLNAANPPVFIESDTISVTMTGVRNLVVIDTLNIESSSVSTVTNRVSGEITQTGESNHVEIMTGNSNREKQTKQQVEIKQTGKNNTIKIHSR